MARLSEHTDAPETRDSPPRRGAVPTIVVLLVCLAGLTALVCTLLGSISVGLVAGLAVLIVALGLFAWIARHPRNTGPEDGSRRRFLQIGLGGVALVGAGAALGRVVEKGLRPDAIAVEDAAADDLGAEYMELIARASNAERSGDLQLLLAPFNSANYSFESLGLHPRDPRTSHAAVWMYLERIPLVAYGPGVIEPGDSEDRVSLADLAPSTANLIGFDGWPGDREGNGLPGLRTTGVTPKVVVTYVFDGGGWNVLRQWPNDWPNLQRLMREGDALPQRAHRIVPRRDGVRARDDRDRHLPTPARHHRPQHPRRRHRAEGLSHAGERRSERHPGADARRPVARRDRRLGRPDRLPGLAHGHDRPRGHRTGPPPTCPSASTSTNRAATAGSPTTPTCSGCPRPRRGWTCSRRAWRPSTTRTGTPSGRYGARPTAACRRSPRTRATCSRPP